MLELAKLDDLDEIMIDIDEVKKLFQARGLRTWPENYPSIEMVMCDIQEERIYIWRENNRIVGSFMFATNTNDPHYYEVDFHYTDDPNYGLIHRMNVIPEYQKRRIEYDMLEGIEKVAIDRHISYLRTAITSDNKMMSKILENLGYQKTGEVSSIDNIIRCGYEKKLVRE